MLKVNKSARDWFVELIGDGAALLVYSFKMCLILFCICWRCLKQNAVWKWILYAPEFLCLCLIFIVQPCIMLTQNLTCFLLYSVFSCIELWIVRTKLLWWWISFYVWWIAPRYIVGKSEMEASKEGKVLRDFRYGCIGYSLYADQKNRTSDTQQSEPELPVCIGLEVSFMTVLLLCVLELLWFRFLSLDYMNSVLIQEEIML